MTGSWHRKQSHKITVMSWIYAHGRWTYTKRGWAYFRELWYFPKIRPPHTLVTLALFMYTCCDSSMPLLSCICLCNSSKWCLPSFVSPSSCTVLLLQCFLLSSMYCAINGWAYFQVKSTLWNNFLQKRGMGVFSYVHVSMYVCVCVCM